MKTVLVTGGNRGIGLEVCKQLDQMGYTVILGSREHKQGIEASRLLSDRTMAVQLDVTDEESIHNLAGLVAEKFGKLNVLINNAALGTDHSEQKNTVADKTRDFVRTNLGGAVRTFSRLTGRLKNTDPGSSEVRCANVPLESVKVIMETNFYGPWRMIQAFLPLLIESDDSRIINVSSGLGELASLNGGYPGYSLSKAALNALTLSFSTELKEKGILVNAMCPGWVRTRMGGPNATRKVEEGADTIVWLASTDHSTTGRFFRDRNEIPW